MKRHLDGRTVYQYWSQFFARLDEIWQENQANEAELDISEFTPNYAWRRFCADC